MLCIFKWIGKWSPPEPTKDTQHIPANWYTHIHVHARAIRVFTSMSMRVQYVYLQEDTFSFLPFFRLQHCILVTNLEVFWMVVVFPTSAANDLECQFSGHVNEVESSSLHYSNEHATLKLRILIHLFPYMHLSFLTVKQFLQERSNLLKRTHSASCVHSCVYFPRYETSDKQ